MMRALLVVFAAAVALGTCATRAQLAAPPRVEGGWLVSGDFHVHAFPGDGMLIPGELRREARRRNLHVFAVTNHNQRLHTKLARAGWQRELPIVMAGEEVTMRAAHVIALGLRTPAPWRAGPSAAIDSIHARGGVAILAHPSPVTDEAFSESALSHLHGVEVANGFAGEAGSTGGRAIYAKHALAAIGSSDFHHVAPLGVQRTILLVTQLDEEGVLDAIRNRRTAVRLTAGWVGDTAVIAAASSHQDALFEGRSGWVGVVACLIAWIALVGLVFNNGRSAFQAKPGEARAGMRVSE